MSNKTGRDETYSEDGKQVLYGQGQVYYLICKDGDDSTEWRLKLPKTYKAEKLQAAFVSLTTASNGQWDFYRWLWAEGLDPALHLAPTADHSKPHDSVVDSRPAPKKIKAKTPSVAQQTRLTTHEVSDTNLSLHFGFFEGSLYDRHIDQPVLGPRLISSISRTPAQIAYFAITGKWFNEVIQIEPNQGLTYNNLIHSDFELEKTDQISLSKTEEHLAFDPEEQEIFWAYSKQRSGLSNALLEGQGIIINFGGSRLVNWFGHIFLYEPFATYFFTGLQEQETSGAYFDLDEFDFEYDLDDDKYGREKRIQCFYCGDDSSITRDHVIPVSSGQGPRSYSAADTVPCCTECNSLLGNKWITTVEERACYLAERIATRYRSTIESADFSETEILQLGPRLKSMILANAVQKKFIAARIAHCHKVAGSLYDPGKVSHLRGATTYAKKLALNLITEYVYETSSVDQFVDQWSEKVDAPSVEIRKILNEKMHVDVAIQFKYEQGFNLSASLHQCAKLMRQQRN